MSQDSAGRGQVGRTRGVEACPALRPSRHSCPWGTCTSAQRGLGPVLQPDTAGPKKGCRRGLEGRGREARMAFLWRSSVERAQETQPKESTGAPQPCAEGQGDPERPEGPGSSWKCLQPLPPHWPQCSFPCSQGHCRGCHDWKGPRLPTVSWVSVEFGLGQGAPTTTNPASLQEESERMQVKEEAGGP